MTPSETGKRGEALAAELLESKGHVILERNYRFGREEVDLITFEASPDNLGGSLVFIEVKARSGTGFGRPEDAVDAAKQAAIKRVAEAFLHERKLHPSPVRFDVVAVLFGNGEPQVEHFEHAFGIF